MNRLVEERDRRWAAARDIMRDNGVDALIAVSDYGDQNGLARYLANFRSSYDTMAVMLHADEGCDLVLTHAGGIPIARQISWATDVLPRALPDAAASDAVLRACRDASALLADAYEQSRGEDA